MKYTTRIQPFVAVTQKEANALEMERKLDDIILRKDINPHLKMRLYQDRLARLINFRKENDLKDDRSEPMEPMIDFHSEPPNLVDESFTVAAPAYSSLFEPVSTPKPSKIPKFRPAKTVVQPVPSRPRKTIEKPPCPRAGCQTAAKPPPVITGVAAKKQANSENKKQPGWMRSTTSSRRLHRIQEGSGRLYVRAWNLY